MKENQNPEFYREEEILETRERNVTITDSYYQCNMYFVGQDDEFRSVHVQRQHPVLGAAGREYHWYFQTKREIVQFRNLLNEILKEL